MKNRDLKVSNKGRLEKDPSVVRQEPERIALARVLIDTAKHLIDANITVNVSLDNLKFIPGFRSLELLPAELRNSLDISTGHTQEISLDRVLLVTARNLLTSDKDVGRNVVINTKNVKRNAEDRINGCVNRDTKKPGIVFPLASDRKRQRGTAKTAIELQRQVLLGENVTHCVSNDKANMAVRFQDDAHIT